MNPLYTWRDVERLLHQQEAPPWHRASADTETLVVTYAPERRHEVMQRLAELFGRRLSADCSTLALESYQQPRRLDVLIEEAVNGEIARQPVIRPLWLDAERAPDGLPPLPEGSPTLAAFYSYKGGVGRTTTLLATLGALLERAVPVLVVDADLEAPGLTFDIPGPPDRFCLLDFLALVQDADDWREILPLAAERIRRNRESLELATGRAWFHFLPAHRDDEQLFVHPLGFEQVVRTRGRANVIAEALAALGKELGAGAVLVDLRAGVTELSSPLLLDPRVQSLLVTSCGTQSYEGTLRVLGRMRTRAQRETSPEIVLTMIPTTLPDDDLAELSGMLKAAIPTPDEDMAAEAAIPNVHEVRFADSLLRYHSIAELLRELIPPTDLGHRAGPALARLLVPPAHRAQPEQSEMLEAVAREARKLEYAEANAEPGLLATPALTALFHEQHLPAAVVLGAKGAGKTFAWGQMVVAGAWETFFKLLDRAMPSLVQQNLLAPNFVSPGLVSPGALVFPLLGSRNLDAELTAKVRSAEQAVHQHLQAAAPLTADALHAALESPPEPMLDELLFWTRHIAARLGLPEAAGTSVEAIAAALAERDMAVCLAIDGLEDAFQPSPQVSLSREQQRLLRGLLQRLTIAVRDLRSPHLGLVSFVRRDLAQAAITQNFPQFAALHGKFALEWTSTEALRLVAWLLVRAGLRPVDPGRIPSASYQELRDGLSGFWGERMGPSLKYAFTDRWVIAALSDFQGRLQARDVVRLIRYAAEDTQQGPRLTPRALRNALKSCSKDKIDELKREIPGLHDIFERFRTTPPEQRKIPFQAADMALTPEEIAFLNTHGVLIQVKEGELYLPEIVRHGLGFGLDGGRRAKVLALYRAAHARRP